MERYAASVAKMKSAAKTLNVFPESASAIVLARPVATMDAAISVVHAMKTSSAMAFTNVNKTAFPIAPIKPAGMMDVAAHAAPVPQAMPVKPSNVSKRIAPRIVKGRSVATTDVGTPVESVSATRSAMKNFNAKNPPVSQNAKANPAAPTDVVAPAETALRDRIASTSNVALVSAFLPVSRISNVVKTGVADIAASAEVDRNVATTFVSLPAAYPTVKDSSVAETAAEDHVEPVKMDLSVVLRDCVSPILPR